MAELVLRWTPPRLDVALPWEPTRVPWGGELREPRQGIAVHYDGSSSDAGGLGWLTHPDVRVSYNLAVLDDGSWALIAPLTARAWHVGRSRPSGPPFDYTDGNSALYALTILSSGREDVTGRQHLTAAWLCARLFAREGWDVVADAARTTGHNAEAWPRGRKTDPDGGDRLNPILAVSQIRELLPLFREVPPI